MKGNSVGVWTVSILLMCICHLSSSLLLYVILGQNTTQTVLEQIFSSSDYEHISTDDMCIQGRTNQKKTKTLTSDVGISNRSRDD